MPEADGYDKCRCCHAARETQMHLHRCSALWQVWKEFRFLIGELWQKVKPSPELTFLGITEKGDFPPLAIRALHAILWKMIIIEFTLTGLEPGKVFASKSIFPYVVTRMHTRLSAVAHSHRTRVSAALRHDKKPPSDDKINEILCPFAVMQGCKIAWHEAWKRKCVAYDFPLTSFQ